MKKRKLLSCTKNIVSILNENAIIIVFFVFFIASSLMFDTFFTIENLTNILRSASIQGIVAVGMTLVIICGEIDLSVGSVVALGGVIAAEMIINDIQSIYLVILIAILSGIICGAFNALMVVKLKIPSFIATLSVQFAVRGIVYIITNEVPINIKNPPEAFKWLSSGSILPLISTSAMFFILLCLVASITLKYTVFGRSLYALGGNIEAANMMGVRTDHGKGLAYIISGALSAFAGVILASRLNAAEATAGEGMEMKVIAGVVLGGTLLRGGVGKMWGTFFGMLFLTLLSTFFNNLGTINSFWQNVITGILLLVVVLFQVFSERSVKKIEHV
ncbi:MAG: ABC transporter permease [Flexilinea sp.]